jgi:hypothetical protein
MKVTVNHKQRKKHNSMSDINETHSIERNGVSKVLSKFKILKGDNKDTEYLAPKFTTESWEQDKVWLGDSLMGIAQKWVKSGFQSLWYDAIGEDGVFNWPKFLKEGAEFDASSMKLKEINELLDEVQAKLGLLIATAEIVEVNGLPTFVNPEDQQNIKRLNNEQLALRGMKDARSRKSAKSENDADPAVAVS